MSSCNTPINFTLFLVSLWAPTAICSLTLGSSGVRRKLAIVSEYNGYTKSEHLMWRTLASIFGSFLLHVVAWNITAASLLSDPTIFTTIYWLWAIRPLPSTFITILTFAYPALFLENALEMQLVEGLQGMLTIKVYNDIRRSIPVNAIDEVRFNLKDGSQTGVGFWSLSLVVLLYSMGIPKYSIRIFTTWSLIFNVVRMGIGLAIWSAFTSYAGNAFCPSPAAIGTVAAVSTGVTISDHIWRAMFCVGRVGWLSNSLRAILSSHDPRGWPMDVTYRNKIEDIPMNARETRRPDSG